MSAERLREAASQMRERAEAASPSPWEHETESGGAHSIVADDGTFVCELEDGYYENGGIGGYDVPATADAAHIASWHPAVALAVADWLTLVARGWSDDPGCDLGGGMDGPPCGECFKCAYYENQHRALAVARAYLGGTP